MNTQNEKVMSLAEAVGRYVPNGAHISIGGFTINRNPMAAVYEIIRQQRRGLHLYAHSNGHGADELIGAGCVARMEVAYAGSGRFAPTCIRFKKAVQNGQLKVEDYSNYQMTLRFTAGAMGVPFLPTRSSMGTDLVEKWGFSAEERNADPSLPNDKLLVVDNPFGDWAEATRVALVPAINPDVTIIHAQKAGPKGTVQIQGLPFADVEQVKASRHVIVTCEELVATETLRTDSDRNAIPFMCVDAVVHVPMGAYPTACYRYYDYDPVYLNDYKKAAADDTAYGEFLKTFVLNTPDHPSLLNLIGKERLSAIKADPRTGYAVGLDRR